MSSYKCRKNTESINSRVSKNNNGKTILSKYIIYYQNMQYVVAKNQDLFKNKKQVEY